MSKKKKIVLVIALVVLVGLGVGAYLYLKNKKNPYEGQYFNLTDGADKGKIMVIENGKPLHIASGEIMNERMIALNGNPKWIYKDVTSAEFESIKSAA